MPAPALRVREVTKRYGSFVAVAGLSFEVPAGSIYGVLGPNGAGKTTTLRMINDILAPDEGEIEILGSLRPGREASKHLGYLPEERGLYPKMRVLELLQFFGELRGLRASAARARGRAWLERLDLASWAKSRVQDLSKGMQQKVQFAAAVVHDPEILILDEPWSGLDPINAEVLREVVLEQKGAGRTILFSTHLMEQAEKLCDRVCIIARGERALEGELAQIKREAAGDRFVAIAFGSDESRDRALSGPLASRALVAAARERAHQVEVEVASQSSPDELLAALVAAGTPIRRFELVEPSLHQIFVDRVGAEAAADRPVGRLPAEAAP
jgi:ABC-2 type transport system ATP-binding protein